MTLSLPAGPVRVLAIGAHPDDIEIGCGATLLALGQRDGMELRTLVMTGTDERAAEARSAAVAFGATSPPVFAGLPDARLPAAWDAVRDALHAFRDSHPDPDLVLVPRGDDAHQDHGLIGTLAPTVWRGPLLLHYEIPKWDGDLGRPNVYVPVSDELATRKLELLHESFPSQADRPWWDDELFRSVLRLRGMEAGHRYAEAFVAHKAVLDPLSPPR